MLAVRAHARRVRHHVRDDVLLERAAEQVRHGSARVQRDILTTVRLVLHRNGRLLQVVFSRRVDVRQVGSRPVHSATRSVAVHERRERFAIQKRDRVELVGKACEKDLLKDLNENFV